MENILNNALCKYECIIFAGDTNTNLLKNTTESRNIIDLCNNFDLRNIIKEPTCFVQNCKTLIDLILTKKCISQKCFRYWYQRCSSCGMCCTVRTNIKNRPQNIQYRSYKNFSDQKLLDDIKVSM